MNEKTYLKERLENEISWYEKNSKKNKQRYYFFRTIEFLSAALIPFLIKFSCDSETLKLAVEILGIIVLVSTGVISLFQFNELWTEYRANAESLKHERYLYITSTTPYDSPDKFMILVERVEQIISKENSRWRELSFAEHK